MRACCVPMVCLVAGGCAHSAPPSGIAAPIESADVVSPSAFSNPAATAEEASARALVEKLGRHEYQAATADFDEKLKAALPPDTLEKAWSQAEGTWGSLVSIEEAQAQPYSKGWGRSSLAALIEGFTASASSSTRMARSVDSGTARASRRRTCSSMRLGTITRSSLMPSRTPSCTMPLPPRSSRKPGPTSKRRLVLTRGFAAFPDQGSFALVVVAFAAWQADLQRRG